MFFHQFVSGRKGVRGHLKKAAIEAGYKDSPYLDDTIYEIQRDPEWKAALQRFYERQDLSDERIIAEYCRIAFANVTDAFRVTEAGEIIIEDLDQLPPDVSAAIAEIKPVIHQETGQVFYGIKMHDKKGALDFLAKLRGLIRAPDIQVTLIQLMANLNLALYSTEDLITLRSLLTRGMPPGMTSGQMPGLPGNPADQAKPVGPSSSPPPPPTNGHHPTNGSGH